MNVEIAFDGPASSVEVLAAFLRRKEDLIHDPVERPKVVVGDDGWSMWKQRLQPRTTPG